MNRYLALAVISSIFLTAEAQAQDTPPDPFVCRDVPAPIISLDHGSRYAEGDVSRSDPDIASSRDVDKQLKPVDSFITDLSAAANRAVLSEEDQPAAAACVLSGLLTWAKADALSDLATMNAHLSAPSRIAGFSFAYAQVQPFLAEPEDQAVIEAWLESRATATMTYFDNEAPRNASRNNLRAWAALAVARVGLTVNDTAMIEWADTSVRLVICQAAADGSLPLEMARRELALHYQLHAITPLVVAAALLEDRGSDLFSACDGALHRIVSFALAAFEEPEMIEALTGYTQTYFDGSEELGSFEIAWAEAYLSLFSSSPLEDFVANFRPMANSKIGGRQALLWAR